MKNHYIKKVSDTFVKLTAAWREFVDVSLLLTKWQFKNFTQIGHKRFFLLLFFYVFSDRLNNSYCLHLTCQLTLYMSIWFCPDRCRSKKIAKVKKERVQTSFIQTLKSKTYQLTVFNTDVHLFFAAKIWYLSHMKFRRFQICTDSRISQFWFRD